MATALTLAFAFILALAFGIGVASTESNPGAASVQTSGAASSTSSATQMLGRLAKVEVNQRASSSEVEALKNFALNVGLKKMVIPNPFS